MSDELRPVNMRQILRGFDPCSRHPLTFKTHLIVGWVLAVTQSASRFFFSFFLPGFFLQILTINYGMALKSCLHDYFFNTQAPHPQNSKQITTFGFWSRTISHLHLLIPVATSNYFCNTYMAPLPTIASHPRICSVAKSLSLIHISEPTRPY